jgi:hypothetical protein
LSASWSRLPSRRVGRRRSERRYLNIPIVVSARRRERSAALATPRPGSEPSPRCVNGPISWVGTSRRSSSKIAGRSCIGATGKSATSPITRIRMPRRRGCASGLTIIRSGHAKRPWWGNLRLFRCSDEDPAHGDKPTGPRRRPASRASCAAARCREPARTSVSRSSGPSAPRRTRSPGSRGRRR